MNYELLPKSEWSRLAPIWAEHGSTPPVDDPFALLSVAMDGERIAGCMGMQSVLHIEGIWSDPFYSGRVGFRTLRKQLLDALPKGVEYYAFAPSWPVARICEYGHMERKDWAVYKGRT
jgi:hypothetical protein